MRVFQIWKRQYYGDNRLRRFVVPDGCAIICHPYELYHIEVEDEIGTRKEENP